MEAPFRALRLVLFGFFVVSASVGALIATTQVIAALNNAPQVSQGRRLQSGVIIPACRLACLQNMMSCLPADSSLSRFTSMCQVHMQALPLNDVATSLGIDIGGCAWTPQHAGRVSMVRAHVVAAAMRLLWRAGARQADSAADARGSAGRAAPEPGQWPAAARARLAGLRARGVRTACARCVCVIP